MPQLLKPVRLEPVRLEPVLCDGRGLRSEEWPLLAATREGLLAATKTQRSQKKKSLKTRLKKKSLTGPSLSIRKNLHI